MLQRINSLSIKLFGVFLITGIAYFYLLDFGVRSLILNEEVRDTLDYYQTSYLGNLMEDLGYPPNAQTAAKITQDMPFDILITGGGFEWSSTDKFPNTDEIDFQPSRWDSIKINNGNDQAPKIVEDSKFARYQYRTYFQIPYGEYIITMVNPKVSIEAGPTYLFEAIALISLSILLLTFLLVKRMINPIQNIQQAATKIGQGDLKHRINVSREDELGVLAKEINFLADNVVEMLEAKQRLNMGVSHELRSPLTRAKLQVEMLNDPIKRENLLDEIQAMESIISTLLESEAINYGHKKLDLGIVDIHKTIEDLISTSQFLDGIKIRFDFCEEITIDADPILFQVMLKNILENASRYTSDKKKQIDVETHQEDHSIEITIRDYGPGLNMKDIEKVFEPFYRAEESRSRNSGGYGLGLYLTKQIVDAHGGQISIRNHENNGAEVRVILPTEQS